MTIRDLSDAALARLAKRVWKRDPIGDEAVVAILYHEGIHVISVATLMVAVAAEIERREDATVAVS